MDGSREMAKRKYNPGLDRLILMDEMLSKSRHLGNRSNFHLRMCRRMGTRYAIETFDKDVKFLRERIARKSPHVELVCDRAAGYRYSEPGYSYFQEAITEDDRDLLFLANDLFNQFSGTSLQAEYGKVIRKVIEEALPEGAEGLAETIGVVQTEQVHSEASSKWIPELLKAIFRRQVLFMDYLGEGRRQADRKLISPYLLKSHNRRWYLVAHDGYCKRPQKTNTYALDGIQGLTPPPSAFAYVKDPAFSASDFFRYSIGVWHFHDREPVDVVLAFSGQHDLIQRSPLHHTQEARLSKDRKILTVRIRVYESPELDRLILGYGASVRVLEPRSLVRSVARTARLMAQQYKGVR